MTDHTPGIALTLGDPAGIGPELAVRLAAVEENRRKATIYLLADREEVEAASAAAGVEFPLVTEPEPGAVVLVDDRSAPATAIPTKVVSKEAGERTLHQLRRAVALANEGVVGGIVFAPLNKTSLHLGGMHEEDELRWFAKQLDFTGTTSELNVLDGLWTARVTSHIPLSGVAERVTVESVTKAIELLHGVLRDAGMEPRIGVCALNPHAGENGKFGRHEIDLIQPAIAQLAARGLDVQGPLPSDTIFIHARDGRFDGVLTMYHDQGQIAVKLLGFDRGVTMAGGLSVPVCTPAHGTAFDVVGERRADTGAYEHAFGVAVAVGAQAAAARVG
jgi:4-hydroxy-L-threonine phosphate dehydrogenase PdxA